MKYLDKTMTFMPPKAAPVTPEKPCDHIGRKRIYRGREWRCGECGHKLSTDATTVSIPFVHRLDEVASWSEEEFACKIAGAITEHLRKSPL